MKIKTITGHNIEKNVNETFGKSYLRTEPNDPTH